MNTQTIPDSVLEELLDNDIPCGMCGQPAQLRSFVHHCHMEARPLPVHKCIKCWQAWVTDLIQFMATGEKLGCRYCHQFFQTIESFSDYREF